MDREQILQWAREAGGYFPKTLVELYPDELERFARLVRNAALEEAKQACKRFADDEDASAFPNGYARACADAIEALKCGVSS